MRETIERVKQNQPVILYHPDFKRCYIEGINSIHMNMPAPCGISGGEAFDNFAIVSIKNTVNHLLGHGIPFKAMKLNKLSDWKNSSNCFYSLFHEELHEKLQS
jgi:hypothetical protein